MNCQDATALTLSSNNIVIEDRSVLRPSARYNSDYP